MEFTGFPKIARLNREIIVTEKIDGTNAQIFIKECSPHVPHSLELNDRFYVIWPGSRNRWITTQDDNFGFAKWVEENKQELLKLGPGAHFGEWYGKGIQHGYGMTDKRFALFNVSRWSGVETRPACCGVVPILYQGPFNQASIDGAVEHLRQLGSVMVPGFMKPEGIIVYHTAANQMFKVTLIKDESPKGVK